MTGPVFTVLMMTNWSQPQVVSLCKISVTSKHMVPSVEPEMVLVRDAIHADSELFKLTKWLQSFETREASLVQERVDLTERSD